MESWFEIVIVGEKFRDSRGSAVMIDEISYDAEICDDEGNSDRPPPRRGKDESKTDIQSGETCKTAKTTNTCYEAGTETKFLSPTTCGTLAHVTVQSPASLLSCPYFVFPARSLTKSSFLSPKVRTSWFQIGCTYGGYGGYVCTYVWRVRMYGCMLMEGLHDCSLPIEFVSFMSLEIAF